MSARMAKSLDTPNQVSVQGLALRTLELFLAGQGAGLSFFDIQAALSLDKRSTEKALDALVRHDYLSERRSKPARFALMPLVTRLLTKRDRKLLNRSDGIEALTLLLRQLEPVDSESLDCKVSAVTVVCPMINSASDSQSALEVLVSVTVGRTGEALMRMKDIERIILKAPASLRIGLSLNIP